MSIVFHEFIFANRDLIIQRAKGCVRERMPPGTPEVTLDHGVPIFLTQLVDALARAASANALRLVRVDDSAKVINDSAALHGCELLESGFTIGQVVHGYGDVCQIVTALATETRNLISVDEFHVFNRCLDDAIAGAVSAYMQQRERDLEYAGTERLGILAHELRNLVHGATLSYNVIKRGTVGFSGSTGAMLARCLSGLSALVAASLAEVRLDAGKPELERILLAELIEEIEVDASLQAEGKQLSFVVAPVESALVIEADRPLLTSAIANLLQNAFKFTPSPGKVTLTTRSSTEQVFIEVADECGGLPPGAVEKMFLPFAQASADRTGVGLGLTIAYRAVRANSGDLTVRDIPGVGCVFTIALPRQTSSPTSIAGGSEGERPSAPNLASLSGFESKEAVTRVLADRR